MMFMFFRDLYNNMDGQITNPVVYFNGSNLPEQSQHPPYIPPCISLLPKFTFFFLQLTLWGSSFLS